MQNREIDLLIDRARRAYLRRPDFDGRAPRIADCDVELRGDREWVVLRDGDDVVAQFKRRSNGDLEFVPTKH